MMQRLIYKLILNQKLTIPIIVLIITAGIYSVYGFEGELSRDNANHLYSGQMMADGIPPYVGFFNHTGPLVPILTGLVVTVSNNFQWDDIYTVRLLFFLIGCFTVLSVYLLANNLFNSNRVGIFSALVFLGFSDFAKEAANGPQKKTPMVLFATMSLLLTSKKRWFWAGLFGSLASLTWQPAVIFPIVTLFLAFRSGRKRVVNALFNTCAGILLPSAAMFAYFQYHGAVKEFLEGYILFNFYYLDRGEYPLISHLLRPLHVVLTRYTYTSVTIIIGFFMILYIYIWRFSINNSYKKLLNNDHFAPVLISFPLIIILSLFDFQSAPDFYIFLPYVAMGFAFFIEQAIGFLEKTNSTLVTKMPTHLFTLATFLILIGMATANAFLNREDGLHRQKRTAIIVEEKFGKNYKLISIGVPQLLVLLQKKNPVPYAFIESGIDQLIQARTPGGFEGWLQELEIYDPDVIAYGPSRGVHLIKLENWLKSRYQLTQIGPWRLYVKNIHTRFYYKDFECELNAKPAYASTYEGHYLYALNVVSKPHLNVILISIDTLRADHLGSHGYHRQTSPYIDALTKDGIIFLNARSQSPWTLPSHATMLTSLNPSTHGARFWKNNRFLNIKNVGGNVLPKWYLTLAEILNEVGYNTAAFTSSAWLSSNFGLAQGFSKFEMDFERHTSKVIVDKAIDWAGHKKGKPYFIFLHFNDVREYNSVPEYDGHYQDQKYQGKLRNEDLLQTKINRNMFESLSDADLEYLIAKYDSEISYVDFELGGLFNWLRSKDLYDKTRLIITSDHGEEFWDHGGTGYSFTLYEEQLRVHSSLSHRECIIAKESMSIVPM